MSNEELKKKIVEIIQSVDFYDGLLYRYCIDIATADKLADALIENGFGNVADWKRRAEVGERALLILCDKVMRNVLVMAFPSTKAQVWNKQELYDYCMAQAEKELTEGKRDE